MDLSLILHAIEICGRPVSGRFSNLCLKHGLKRRKHERFPAHAFKSWYNKREFIKSD